MNLLISVVGNWASASAIFRCVLGVALTSYYAHILLLEPHLVNYVQERVQWIQILVEIEDGDDGGVVLSLLGPISRGGGVSKNTVWVDNVAAVLGTGLLTHLLGSTLVSDISHNERRDPAIHLQPIPILLRQKLHTRRPALPHRIHHHPL